MASREISAATLAEIKLDKRSAFTPEEARQFTEMGAILAGKAVMYALAEVVAMNPAAPAALVARVRAAAPFNYCGYTKIEFGDPEIPYILNVSLTLAERIHRTRISIPSGFEQDLYKQYEFLKQIAIAYYKHWTIDNAALIAEITPYCPGADLSELRVDPANLTSLYFDADCPKRASVFCYYTTLDGKPLIKVE